MSYDVQKRTDVTCIADYAACGEAWAVVGAAARYEMMLAAAARPSAIAHTTRD